MGKRGPKPKPNAIKLLEGNRGGRPLKDEVILELPAQKPGIVFADELASAEWDRLIRVMPPQLYNAAHETVLSQHCLAWSSYVKAQAELSEFGPTIDTPRGLVPNPALRAWRIASDTLLRTAALLALHPGAKVTLPGRTETSKFAGLLGKRPS